MTNCSDSIGSGSFYVPNELKPLRKDKTFIGGM